MDYNDEIENRIVKNMSKPTVVAWGECGLDYFKSEASTQQQHNAFTRQMKKAVELNKPLIVHSRDADDDTYRLMNECLPKDHPIHLHCFSSTLQFAEKMLSSFPNLCVGFTGAITFSSAAKQREVVTKIPLDRLLLETDGPFMAPDPWRGSIAHPGMVVRVGEEVAKLKGLSIDEVLKQTTTNVQRVYNCFKDGGSTQLNSN